MEDFEIILAWDNGVTGSYTCLSLTDDEISYSTIPTKKERSYTKKVQYITRVNYNRLYNDLNKIIHGRKCRVVMERPMIMGQRFFSSMSAIRCLETETLIIENLGLTIEFLDSKSWQRVMLPNIKGRENLKLESMHLAQKLYPSFYLDIQKQKDGDSFLIATYIKNSMLNKKEV